MESSKNSKIEQGVFAVDAVCGMRVDPATAAHRYEYQGKSFYFCCQHCLEKFRAEPNKYAPAGESRGSGLVTLAVQHTVPHISQPSPGGASVFHGRGEIA